MDENFEFFLENMGPCIKRRGVPSSSIERYRGKLPDQLLAYWKEYGWCGYAEGLFWVVNPEEYEPVLEACIGNTFFMEKDAYHIIARSAFGHLYFWGEKTGDSLRILPWNALAFPSNESERFISQKKNNEVLQWFFGGLDKCYLEIEDDHEKPLFDRALKKLGRLSSDEIYGFVPALALGGPAELNHMEKLKAVEHLVFLAQLAPLEIMENPYL